MFNTFTIESVTIYTSLQSDEMLNGLQIFRIASNFFLAKLCAMCIFLEILWTRPLRRPILRPQSGDDENQIAKLAQCDVLFLSFETNQNMMQTTAQNNTRHTS